jgi:hypothetical protein
MIFYMLIMTVYIMHVKSLWITLNMVYDVSNGIITQCLIP